MCLYVYIYILGDEGLRVLIYYYYHCYSQNNEKKERNILNMNPTSHPFFNSSPSGSPLPLHKMAQWMQDKEMWKAFQSMEEERKKSKTRREGEGERPSAPLFSAPNTSGAQIPTSSNRNRNSLILTPHQIYNNIDYRYDTEQQPHQPSHPSSLSLPLSTSPPPPLRGNRTQEGMPTMGNGSFCIPEITHTTTAEEEKQEENYCSSLPPRNDSPGPTSASLSLNPISMSSISSSSVNSTTNPSLLLSPHLTLSCCRCICGGGNDTHSHCASRTECLVKHTTAVKGRRSAVVEAPVPPPPSSPARVELPSRYPLLIDTVLQYHLSMKWERWFSSSSTRLKWFSSSICEPPLMYLLPLQTEILVFAKEKKKPSVMLRSGEETYTHVEEPDNNNHYPDEGETRTRATPNRSGEDGSVFQCPGGGFPPSTLLPSWEERSTAHRRRGSGSSSPLPSLLPAPPPPLLLFAHEEHVEKGKNEEVEGGEKKTLGHTSFFPFTEMNTREREESVYRTVVFCRRQAEERAHWAQVCKEVISSTFIMDVQSRLQDRPPFTTLDVATRSSFSHSSIFLPRTNIPPDATTRTTGIRARRDGEGEGGGRSARAPYCTGKGAEEAAAADGGMRRIAISRTSDHNNKNGDAVTPAGVTVVCVPQQRTEYLAAVAQVDQQVQEMWQSAQNVHEAEGSVIKGEDQKRHLRHAPEDSDGNNNNGGQGKECTNRERNYCQGSNMPSLSRGNQRNAAKNPSAWTTTRPNAGATTPQGPQPNLPLPLSPHERWRKMLYEAAVTSHEAWLEEEWRNSEEMEHEKEAHERQRAPHHQEREEVRNQEKRSGAMETLIFSPSSSVFTLVPLLPFVRPSTTSTFSSSSSRSRHHSAHRWKCYCLETTFPDDPHPHTLPSIKERNDTGNNLALSCFPSPPHFHPPLPSPSPSSSLCNGDRSKVQRKEEEIQQYFALVSRMLYDQAVYRHACTLPSDPTTRNTSLPLFRPPPPREEEARGGAGTEGGNHSHEKSMNISAPGTRVRTMQRVHPFSMSEWVGQEMFLPLSSCSQFGMPVDYYCPCCSPPSAVDSFWRREKKKYENKKQHQLTEAFLSLSSCSSCSSSSSSKSLTVLSPGANASSIANPLYYDIPGTPPSSTSSISTALSTRWRRKGMNRPSSKRLHTLLSFCSPPPPSLSRLSLSARGWRFQPILFGELQAYWKIHCEAEERARRAALKKGDVEAYAKHINTLQISAVLEIMERTHKFMFDIGRKIAERAALKKKWKQQQEEEKGREREKYSKSEHDAHEPNSTATCTTSSSLPQDSFTSFPHLAQDTIPPPPPIPVPSKKDPNFSLSVTQAYQRFKTYLNQTKNEFHLIHSVETFVEEQPTTLRATLLPHQMDGLRFLASLHANEINGILADEMGVGKTIQTLAFLLHLKESEQRTKNHEEKSEEEFVHSSRYSLLRLPPPPPPCHPRLPHLVLAPLSVVREWAEACDNFLPPGQFRVVEYLRLVEEEEEEVDNEANDDEKEQQQQPTCSGVHRMGNTSDGATAVSTKPSSSSSFPVTFRYPAKGRCILEQVYDYDLILLPIHTVRYRLQELKLIQWCYVIIDEAHKAVANLNTITAQSILQLPFRRRLVLTGTPLSGNIRELWSLLYFLNPDVFSDEDTFDHVFQEPFRRHRCADVSGLTAEHQALVVLRLHQILRPFLLRRTKRDVCPNLRRTNHTMRCPVTSMQGRLLSMLRTRKKLPIYIPRAEEKRKSDEDDDDAEEVAEEKKADREEEETQKRLEIKDNHHNSEHNKVPQVDRSISANPHPVFPHPLCSENSPLSSCSGDGGSSLSSASCSPSDAVSPPSRFLDAAVTASLDTRASLTLSSLNISESTALSLCNHTFMLPFFSQVCQLGFGLEERVQGWPQVEDSHMLSHYHHRLPPPPTPLSATTGSKPKNEMALVKKSHEKKKDMEKADSLSMAQQQEEKSHREHHPHQPERQMSSLHSDANTNEEKEKEKDHLLSQYFSSALYSYASFFSSSCSTRQALPSASSSSAFSFPLASNGAAPLLLACSGKFLVLHLFLTRVVLARRKAVIFTHWLDMMDLLADYFHSQGWGGGGGGEGKDGYDGRAVFLSGSTDEKDRKQRVQRFHEDPNCSFFVLSMKAGGCGINLQCAHLVILLDRDYTTTNEDQALARVFRLGQRHTVRSISFCTDDPSEEKVIMRAEEKNRPRQSIIEEGKYLLDGDEDEKEENAEADEQEEEENVVSSPFSSSSSGEMLCNPPPSPSTGLPRVSEEATMTARRESALLSDAVMTTRTAGATAAATSGGGGFSHSVRLHTHKKKEIIPDTLTILPFWEHLTARLSSSSSSSSGLESLCSPLPAAALSGGSLEEEIPHFVSSCLCGDEGWSALRAFIATIDELVLTDEDRQHHYDAEQEEKIKKEKEEESNKEHLYPLSPHHDNTDVFTLLRHALPPSSTMDFIQQWKNEYDMNEHTTHRKDEEQRDEEGVFRHLRPPLYSSSLLPPPASSSTASHRTSSTMSLPPNAHFWGVQIILFSLAIRGPMLLHHALHLAEKTSTEEEDPARRQQVKEQRWAAKEETLRWLQLEPPESFFESCWAEGIDDDRTILRRYAAMLEEKKKKKENKKEKNNNNNNPPHPPDDKKTKKVAKKGKLHQGNEEKEPCLAPVTIPTPTSSTSTTITPTTTIASFDEEEGKNCFLPTDYPAGKTTEKKIFTTTRPTANTVRKRKNNNEKTTGKKPSASTTTGAEVSWLKNNVHEAEQAEEEADSGESTQGAPQHSLPTPPYPRTDRSVVLLSSPPASFPSLLLDAFKLVETFTRKAGKKCCREEEEDAVEEQLARPKKKEGALGNEKQQQQHRQVEEEEQKAEGEDFPEKHRVSIFPPKKERKSELEKKKRGVEEDSSLRLQLRDRHKKEVKACTAVETDCCDTSSCHRILPSSSIPLHSCGIHEEDAAAAHLHRISLEKEGAYSYGLREKTNI